MTHLCPNSGYRIGPIQRTRSAEAQRLPLLAAGLGVIALGLLVGFVVVLNQGVERGHQIRAALAAPAVASLGVSRLSGR